MNLSAKFLVGVLEKHGFVFKRSKGSIRSITILLLEKR